MKMENNRSFDELIEKLLNNMIDENNNDEPKSISSQDGKTVINFNQNNDGLMILILYFLKYFQPNHHVSNNANYRENEDQEIEDLIQTVEFLQRKNKDFLEEIKQMSYDKK